MATFLELVNDVERESGTIGQSQRLTTVSGAVGRQEKIVEWTAEAWRMIQRARPDWTFLRKEASHALTIGQARYSATDMGLTDFAAWLPEADGFASYSLYDNAIGRSDETRLRVIPYREWRESYDFGSVENLRPCVVAFDNDRKLCFGNPPDAAYVARFTYRRSIQNLAADVDEPYIAADHHQAIVWLALTLLAEHDEAAVPIATAMNRYREALGQMVLDYTEPVQL